MKELGIIRRMYYRDGLSLSEIERRTGLTRKTVRSGSRHRNKRSRSIDGGQWR
jgi:DNA-binding transcriptional regulator LsrR (DeoR family)